MSAPFRLLRADHYRLGRECRDNEEDDAGCGERDNTHDRCGDDGDKSRDNGREERERERETLLRTVSRTQSHTHSYGYGHYVLNILRSTLTCLIQTGESCCLRFVGDSRADVIRVHADRPTRTADRNRPCRHIHRHTAQGNMNQSSSFSRNYTEAAHLSLIARPQC